MLAFMQANVWLCVVIVIASVLSYFLAGWSRIQIAPPKRAATR